MTVESDIYQFSVCQVACSQTQVYGENIIDISEDMSHW